MEYLPYNRGSITIGSTRTFLVVSFLALVSFECVLCAFLGDSCDLSIMSSPASSSSDSHVYCVAKSVAAEFVLRLKQYASNINSVGDILFVPQRSHVRFVRISQTQTGMTFMPIYRLERRAHNNTNSCRRQKQAKEKASDQSVRCSSVSDPTSSSASTVVSASVANKGT